MSRSDYPHMIKNILEGIVITIIGGVILAFIIRDARFAPKNEIVSLPTDEPVVTISTSNNEPLQKVTFTSPANQSWQDIQSIWLLAGGIEDIPEPGTNVYDIQVSPDDILRWTFAWCATDTTKLSEALSPLTVNFIVDDDSLSAHEILQHDVTASDGWECKYWSTIASAWESGEKIELVINYQLSENINDGRDSYASGSYNQVIRATVR